MTTSTDYTIDELISVCIARQIVNGETVVQGIATPLVMAGVILAKLTHAPDSWLAAVKFLVEEVGLDVNARDNDGYTPLHHAAARGDNDVILYLVSKGADVTVVARNGQTVADMANGPVQRVSPFPATVALLEKLGSKNNQRCVSC